MCSSELQGTSAWAVSSASWGGGGSEGWGGKRDCPGDYSTFALSLRFQLYRGVGLNQLQCSRNILSLELIFASRKLRIQKRKRLKKKEDLPAPCSVGQPTHWPYCCCDPALEKNNSEGGFLFYFVCLLFFFLSIVYFVLVLAYGFRGSSP